MYKKVEDIKRPLKLGELFLVPCVIKESWIKHMPNEEDLWRDVKDVPNFKKKLEITPIINHPHSDKENGQKEIHFHADYRFIKTQKDTKGKETNIIKNTHSNHHWGRNIRPYLNDLQKEDQTIKYFLLPVVNIFNKDITPSIYIKNSKLKHKCIHKGKCPHRGYDLSQVKSKNGIITYPLHGLKFNEQTKKLINEKNNKLAFL